MICNEAKKGMFKTRESFFSRMKENPHIAVQGYNAFGKVFYWNIASTRLYGYTERRATNQELFDLILPPDFRELARSMVASGARTGKMPEPGACDLMRDDGQFISVFSGHLIFHWDTAAPEFYCIDLALDETAENDIRKD